MPQPDGGLPFRALEEQAYHSYREWPVFLALRLRELWDHLDIRPPGQAQSPDGAEKTEDKKEHKA
jgi:hypothetical protein